MEFTNNTESEITLNQAEGDKIETVVIPAGETVEQKVYIDFKDNLLVKEGLVSIEGKPAKKPGPKPDGNSQDTDKTDETPEENPDNKTTENPTEK
ncbi:hypothetical protein vBVpP1_24 [Vibrio phage vB_VpP_1]|nr:hypothetical protein vBVpP1_24 [Vibrio phage vB_VpP_1]